MRRDASELKSLQCVEPKASKSQGHPQRKNRRNTQALAKAGVQLQLADPRASSRLQLLHPICLYKRLPSGGKTAVGACAIMLFATRVFQVMPDGSNQ